jgi:hypothetical protein
LRCGDRSGTRSRSERSRSNMRAAPAGPGELTPAWFDTDVRAGWRGYPGANPGEKRKLPPARGQKSQALGYNGDRFMHILVLPPRRQSIERQGEVFCCATSKNSRRRSAPSLPRSSPRQLPHVPPLTAFNSPETFNALLEKRSRLLFFQAVGHLY